ncbi:MAG: CRISPR-associated protein Cas4 [Faecousia sp.]
MECKEEDFLQLSGLQHFAFCRRQWALIHLEQQWAENLRTTDGELMHARAHEAGNRERRGDSLITRGMYIRSPTLGVAGQCDVVEFHRAPKGVPLVGQEGLWQPYPIEYKRGAPKEHNADALQLCGQALCLEEMLCCEIPVGALFYGQTRRRQEIVFTAELRTQVREMLLQMHELYRRGHTPKVKPTKSCNACSLRELCLPALMKQVSAASYLRDATEEL